MAGAIREVKDLPSLARISHQDRVQQALDLLYQACASTMKHPTATLYSSTPGQWVESDQAVADLFHHHLKGFVQ